VVVVVKGCSGKIVVSGVHSIYPLFPFTKVSRKQRVGVHTHNEGPIRGHQIPPFNPPYKVRG